jgi:hypothetical protein
MFNVIDTNLLENDILAASYNNEKGHWDGVLILSNSVYSQIGKSSQEETHFVEKIINHPNYASKIDLLLQPKSFIHSLPKCLAWVA